MNKRGCALLAAAIINRAVQDWKDAKALLSKFPSDSDALYTASETERFFRSDWYQILREFAPDVIPENMMRRLDR